MRTLKEGLTTVPTGDKICAVMLLECVALEYRQRKWYSHKAILHEQTFVALGLNHEHIVLTLTVGEMRL